MTASDEQAHNALHPARMLRKEARVRDQGALPDLIALADTVTEMRVIKHASGIRAQKSIEL
ncbi:MAG: hypothetical protein Q8J70_08330 [Thiobacillus sp.]|nr:hypothetical protein [Thiobacillus sp.]